VKYHQLIPKKDKSLTDKVSLNDNLIIHGDNLKALKALLPTYAGKVKCIYIDPPYNTGNERWVYNDNVNSPMMQEWLGKVVDREDLTRHDKWLCMMMPRLKLLRELLREDGLIFVSIDDNEVHHLRMLMDEVFQEENFRNLIVVRRGVKSVQGQFESIDKLAEGIEYVLVYTKSKDFRLNQFFIELFETRQGTWNNHWRGTDRPTMRYELFGVTPSSGQWRWSRERSLKAIENYKNLLKELKKNGLSITQKEIDEYYLNKLSDGEDIDLLRLSNTGKPEHYVPPSDYKLGSTMWTDLLANRTKEIIDIFGIKVFENPKSTMLIKRLLGLAGANKDSIVLDSFAGSGTTAHAVLDLNKEDGGNRKFILVECEDYADKITAERVKRVIKGVKNAKDEKLREGLGGTFSYFELGDPIEMESILEGDKLPSYLDLARYVFYTATGEEFDPRKVDENNNFIGESKEYEVYLFYKPDIDYLKSTALTLDRAKELGPYKGKRRLVFAPSKYLDTDYLLEYRIDYCQLPFEIYKLKE
jgi:adenine-specific DNA-methyltransferase